MINVAALKQQADAAGDAAVVVMPREVFDAIVLDLEHGQRCARAISDGRLDFLLPTEKVA